MKIKGLCLVVLLFSSTIQAASGGAKWGVGIASVVAFGASLVMAGVLHTVVYGPNPEGKINADDNLSKNESEPKDAAKSMGILIAAFSPELLILLLARYAPENESDGKELAGISALSYFGTLVVVGLMASAGSED